MQCELKFKQQGEAIADRLKAHMKQHCVGLDNRQSAKHLSIVLGTGVRSIQHALSVLRRRGAPIVSSRQGGGAFYPQSADEAVLALREERAASISHICGTHQLQKNLERHFGHSLKEMLNPSSYPELQLFEAVEDIYGAFSQESQQNKC